MKKINKVEENSDLKPSVMSTEAAEPGGGAGEITPTHNSKNQDEILCVTISLLDTLDDLSQREGGASALADSRIAKPFEEKAPIKPTVSLSCEECTNRTNDLPWKMAQDKYNEIIGIIFTIDIREEPADDEPKKIQETDDEGDRIDGTCREKEDSHEDFPKAKPTNNVDKGEDLTDTSIPTNREEYKIMTSTFHFGVAEMTPEEQEARAQEELSTGPLRVLT